MSKNNNLMHALMHKIWNSFYKIKCILYLFCKYVVIAITYTLLDKLPAAINHLKMFFIKDGIFV